MASRTKKIQVRLDGITPIMFDRYAGDNKTSLKVEDKFYFDKDGKSLIIPAANVMSFLSAQNTTSIAKRFLPAKEYKKVAQGFLSYITINPFSIPLCRNGEQIVFSVVSNEEWQFPLDREVILIDDDGSDATSLLTTSHKTEGSFWVEVAFSPDHSRIAFFDAQSRAQAFNLDSGEIEPMQDFPYEWLSTHFPQW